MKLSTVLSLALTFLIVMAPSLVFFVVKVIDFEREDEYQEESYEIGIQEENFSFDRANK